MRLGLTAGALFLAVLPMSSFSAQSGQTQIPDGCPTAKAAKPGIQRPVDANGFLFSYYSLVFETGQPLWCHERKIANQGPPVYVEWKDNLGPVIAVRHLPAGTKGIARIFAWESGDTEDVPSVIGYGPWEQDTHSENARVYRSISELKNKPVIAAEQKAFAPMTSGLDAVVLDNQGKLRTLGIRIHSEVYGKPGSFALIYQLASKDGAANFLIAPQDRLSDAVSVVFEGKLGKILKPGRQVFAASREGFAAEQVPAVEIETSLLRVFIQGKPAITGRISAYVPAN